MSVALVQEVSVPEMSVVLVQYEVSVPLWR